MTRARKMIQEISGEGEIYAGDRLVRRTRYRLSISEGDASSDSGIKGSIELATDSEAMVLARVEQLTLLLDDGRHLVFSFTGPNGRIQAHGGLEGIKTSPR